MLTTITDGMLFDLARFPGEDAAGLAALETLEDLDRYTYLVAGCVGEFWTDLHLAHRPRLAGWDAGAMRATGVRFGKALQMTNVLRDVPSDLALGRCYLPARELAALGLTPADVLDPGRRRARSAAPDAGCSASRSPTTTPPGATRWRSPAASGACGWPARGRC